MIPYIVVIFLSCTILKGKKYRFSLRDILGILPIVILAGFRDYSIGTDTSGYPIAIFDYCLQSNSPLMALTFVAGDVEPLYVIFEYVVSRFTKDAHWMLFWSHFIMLFNIVFASKKFKINTSICVFLYFCSFFNFSLNGARQSIAMTFLPLIYYYLSNRSYLKSIILFLIAFLFHSSILLCISIFALFFILRRYHYLADKLMTKLVVVLLVVLVLVNFIVVINYITDLGAVRSEYSDRYGNSDMYGSNVPISNIYLNIVNIVLLYKIRKVKDFEALFYEYVAILSMVLCGSALISTFLVRITHYFVIMVLMYNTKNIGALKLKARIIPLLLYFFYWFMITVVNLEETTPYTSKLLGI